MGHLNDPTGRGTTSLSVIIPTYNERENIEYVLSRCLESLDGYDVECIVVDDDSPDRTWAYVDEAYHGDSRVRVLRRTDARGLATAVADGFAASSTEYCAVIDADLQHPPERLLDLLEALEAGADIAIGSRHIDGGGIENWSRARKLVSMGATNIAKALVPATRGIADPMSGFFAVRRELVTDVHLDPTGYKILLELLTKCEYETVVEVPYVFTERERGESKLSATEYQSFLEHLVMLTTINYGLTDHISPSRAVRVAEFAAVGGLGILVNMLVFVFAHDAGFHHLLAGGAAFLVAVNTNFIGNWALRFDRPQADILAMWGKFHAVSAVGFVLYTGILSLAIEMILLPAVLANGVAIVGSSVFNFFGSESLAFGVTDTATGAGPSASASASE